MEVKHIGKRVTCRTSVIVQTPRCRLHSIHINILNTETNEKRGVQCGQMTK